MNGLLGGPHRERVGQLAVCNCQVWDDVVMDAAVGRVLRKGVPDSAGEPAKWLLGLWLQPQNSFTEPSRTQEAAVESTYGLNRCSQGGDDALINRCRFDEGVQDGDMSGHPPGSCPV